MNFIKSKNISKLVLFVSLAVVLSGCGTKRKGVVSGGALSEKSKKELVADVLKNDLKYETISGKVNLELLPANSKKGASTNTFVKLIRDSILQISVRPILGLEVFRLSFTPDSVYVLDRMNKKYAVESINDFANLYGASFNFYNLQALLTNSMFVPGQQGMKSDDYKLFDLSASSDTYLLKTVDKAGLLYNFAIDGTDRIVSTLILSPQKNYTLQWSYKDFIKDGGYIYPTRIQANADINKKRFDLNLSYSKLDINGKVDIDNSVSKKYDRVSVADMIKVLMKLK